MCQSLTCVCVLLTHKLPVRLLTCACFLAPTPCFPWQHIPPWKLAFATVYQLLRRVPGLGQVLPAMAFPPLEDFEGFMDVLALYGKVRALIRVKCAGDPLEPRRRCTGLFAVSTCAPISSYLSHPELTLPPCLPTSPLPGYHCQGRQRGGDDGPHA